MNNIDDESKTKGNSAFLYRTMIIKEKYLVNSKLNLKSNEQLKQNMT